MEHVWIPALSHFPLTKYLSHELDFEKEKDLGQEQWETKLKGCDCCHCTGEGLAPDNGPETICCIDEATYEDSTLLGRRSEVIPSELFLQKPWRFYYVLLVHKSHVAETATRLEDIWICQGLWIFWIYRSRRTEPWTGEGDSTRKQAEHMSLPSGSLSSVAKLVHKSELDVIMSSILHLKLEPELRTRNLKEQKLEFRTRQT